MEQLKKHDDKYKLKHIEKTLVVNCGSKTNIKFFQEKLRNLKIPYIVFHDLDEYSKANVWTLNYTIQKEIKCAKDENLDCRVYIFKCNFEDAHKYNHKTSFGKPFSAYKYVIDEINFADSEEAAKVPLVKFLLHAFNSEINVELDNFDEQYIKDNEK